VSAFLAARNLEEQPLVQRQAKGTLLEAVLWLQLGGAVGYFPQDEAEEAIRVLIGELQFQAEELSYWKSRFPGGARRIIERALDWRGVFEQDFEMQFKRPSDLLDAFQGCLLTSTRFWRVETAQFLSAAIAFDTPPAWESRGKAQLTQMAVAEGLSSDSAVSIDSWPVLCAGLIRTLDHMGSYKDFFTECFNPDRLPDDLRSDALSFRRRVGQIQRWQFDFQSGNTMSRFSECQRAVGKLLFTGGDDAIEAFGRKASELIKDWQERGGATTPMANRANG
jgi:hypothetical protein